MDELALAEALQAKDLAAGADEAGAGAGGEATVTVSAALESDVKSAAFKIFVI